MTPSERERRIEAAGKAFRRGGWLGRSEIEEMLDAADEAVSMVDEEIVKEAFRGGYERGVSSGTLAPRDFSGLEHHWRAWCHEAGFASFSGEEGTEG